MDTFFNVLAFIGGLSPFLFGMETISGAVSGLRDVPAFQQMFIMFKNPLLGVLAGAVLTAIICDPHYHGAEHRRLRDGYDLLRRRQQDGFRHTSASTL